MPQNLVVDQAAIRAATNELAEKLAEQIKDFMASKAQVFGVDQLAYLGTLVAVSKVQSWFIQLAQSSGATDDAISHSIQVGMENAGLVLASEPGPAGPTTSAPRRPAS